MRETYNCLAENYELRQSNPATGLLRRKEIALIKKFASGEVMDLGCGTGYHLKKKTIGLDISEKMLKKAKSKNLIQSRIESLPIKSDSIDTVTCFYGTINLVDLEKSVVEISRVLKNGGKAIISAASPNDIGSHMPSSKIKKFRIEGKPIKMRLYEKHEMAEAFKGFKLIYFNSVFRSQKPRWGNFEKFTFSEKIKIKAESLLPKERGRIYFFVFEKT